MSHGGEERCFARSMVNAQWHSPSDERHSLWLWLGAPSGTDDREVAALPSLKSKKATPSGMAFLF
ncbi:MAG: hypothetical protein NZ837_00015 [Gammaproteobacteria bacterium]|nr:hypothetical protein [Gammaproteobacteria bacterium]